MRFNELQILKEYIIKGNSDDNFDKTFAFLYEKKYLLLMNANSIKDIGFGNGFGFLINDNGKKQLYEILKSLNFTEDYNSFPKAFGEHADKIKDIVIRNCTIHPGKHQLNSPDVEKFFMNVLADQDPIQFSSSLSSSLVYGFNIKTMDNIDNIFSDKELTMAISCPIHYVVIDHIKKSIYRANKTRDYQTRMGGYTGNAAYILVDVEFSIDRMDFLKIAKQVSSNLPGYHIGQQKENEDIKNTIQQILNGKGTIYAYHGTSNAIFNKIKKSGGMVPGMGEEYSDKIKGHSENLIYLTLEPETAQKYAVRASKQRANVILKVKIDDLTKLAFDEDSLFKAVSSIQRSNKKVNQKINAAIQEEFNFHEGYMSHDLKPYFADESKLNDKQQKLLNYVKFYAIKSMVNLSFGYTGVIPLKNVSVYETGKSKKHDPDTYDDDYDEVQINRERT